MADGSGLALINTGGLTGLGGAELSIPMPFTHRIVLLEDTHVAGTTHIRGIEDVASTLKPQQELTLVRDPNNTTDSWAIRVMLGTRKLGYVPADVNQIIARLIDAGKAIVAHVIKVETLGTWTKIHMEVALDD